MYGPRGKRVFTLDVSRIKDFLDISDGCVALLAKIFCLPNYVTRTSLPKPRLDYRALAGEYRQLLASRTCKDQADIARHFDVSRAWVTKVMKKGAANPELESTGI